MSTPDEATAPPPDGEPRPDRPELVTHAAPRLRGPWWRRPGAVGLALIVIAVVAIALFRPVSSDGGDSGPIPPTGSRAPDISGPVRGGPGTVGLADFKGQPVIVNFWASWCGPCREEMPLFAEAARGGAHILGVNSRDREAPALQFLSQSPVPYRSTVDDDGTIAARYGLTGGLPGTFAVGADGKIKAFKIGAVDKAELDRLISIAGR